MDNLVMDRVCKQVYQKFPEISGVRPSSKQNGTDHILVFQSKQKTTDGHTINRTVRVTVNAQGKITKTTTSR
jgi:hypothetical protein